MTTPINMLAIDLAKGSFQVCAIGQDGACVDAPLFGKRNLRFVGGVFDRTCVRPLSVAFMTPRAGMLFGRPGSHRFRELQALEPRD